MLLKDFIRHGTDALSALYDADEARSMVLYYCSEVFGYPSYQHITEPGTEVPADLLESAVEDMRRLSASEPLQYVLGYTEFCGRNFAVDERALIPRGETEVLCQKAVEMLAADAGNDKLRFLDLCTGSGCIAWTLAMDMPGSQVVATDISPDALALARSQFGSRDYVPGWTGRLPKRVKRPVFLEADVLDVEGTSGAALSAVAAGGPLPDGGNDCRFHLLTANPPYVMQSEKTEMRPNVLDWEPHVALFAPDRDPLAFHRAIALIALRTLAPDGKGIVEINSELPEESVAVFTGAGLADVSIIPDYFDRPRFVSFRKQGE